MFPVVPVQSCHAIVLVGVYFVDDGFRQNQSSVRFGGLYRVDGIIHRPDRTDRLAIVVTTAGRSTLPWSCTSGLGNRYRSEPVGIDDLREPFVTVVPGYHIHWIRLATLGWGLKIRIIGAR